MVSIAGGEHAQLIAGGRCEIDLRALRPADPVALHGEHAVRPVAFQLFDVIQQLVRVKSGAQKPLLKRALLHGRGVMAPAAAIHHLFIGQNRGAELAPVHQRPFAISDALLQHLEEKPLIPAIIFRFAGRNFPRPVIREREPVMGSFHLFDIGDGPFARRALVGDGCIFGRQPERIPPHGMQHIVAAHPHVARQHIADRVIPDVADVQGAAWIREHFQDVIFRFRGIVFGSIERRVLPLSRPFIFYFREVVRLFRHFSLSLWQFLLRPGRSKLLHVSLTQRLANPAPFLMLACWSSRQRASLGNPRCGSARRNARCEFQYADLPL